MRRHRTAEDARIHRVHQSLVVLSRRNDLVEIHVGTWQATGGEGDGGVHATEQRATVHPLRLRLGVAGWRRLEIEGLAQSRDDLREAERRVRGGSRGADGADDELERRFDL